MNKNSKGKLCSECCKEVATKNTLLGAPICDKCYTKQDSKSQEDLFKPVDNA